MKSKSDLAQYLYHQGTNYYSYDYLGVNLIKKGSSYTYTFRVWAPNAEEVLLVSDYTGWDNMKKMYKISKGIWEVKIYSSEDLNGIAYKFVILNNGKIIYKGDPYARMSRGYSDGASIIYVSKYKWKDSLYLRKQKAKKINTPGYLSFPINIYELHVGSFMKKENGEYLNYSELGEILVPYLKYMGYTHVEFLPIFEYPFDGSWGYQICSYYAPTNRFGTPDDFKRLIDILHSAGIGVILDWVPAHFPKDAWGLYEFDGQPLYEYQGQDRQESEVWGTRFFDVGREEVQCFLISNALFYFREFHIDALRVDAVASMLYLDYDKSAEKVVKNVYGGLENLEAIAFFQKLNTAVFKEFPYALMIAEESGDFGKITHPTEEGGLGFNLKWNMGWANDFYDYLGIDPIYRKLRHEALTFPIMYSFSENYILPISHDEVVHGKKNFIDKIFGSYEDKFKQARAAILLMMTYPGKKLTFMGTEFAQFREWNYEDQLEWFMLDYETHYSFREYVSSLNNFYLRNEPLWCYDFDNKGFEWILPDEKDKNIILFKRKGKEAVLYVLINFSGIKNEVFIEIKKEERPSLLFSSSGSDHKSERFEVIKENRLKITIDSFEGIIFSLNSNIEFEL